MGFHQRYWEYNSVSIYSLDAAVHSAAHQPHRTYGLCSATHKSSLCKWIDDQAPQIH